jgi:hypothetical protein
MPKEVMDLVFAADMRAYPEVPLLRAQIYANAGKCGVTAELTDTFADSCNA